MGLKINKIQKTEKKTQKGLEKVLKRSYKNNETYKTDPTYKNVDLITTKEVVFITIGEETKSEQAGEIEKCTF